MTSNHSPQRLADDGASAKTPLDARRRAARNAAGLAAVAALLALAIGTLGATLAPRSAALAGARYASVGLPGTAAVDQGHIALDAPVSIDDIHLPAIARLDADLRSAAMAATEAAALEGVEIVITGGWRSSDYQQHLLDQAIERYGSLEEARRWVNTPELSTHVTGDAIDIGRSEAASWMQERGAAFGLCQIYDNEPWHYELAADVDGACPRLLHDSR